jgi:hypothetical protein
VYIQGVENDGVRRALVEIDVLLEAGLVQLAVFPVRGVDQRRAVFFQPDRL